VTVRLREHHDLSFLKQLGEVFCVFDQQDSGNIGFGVDTGTERLFMKYAGAKTICSNCDPAEAVRILEEAMPVYEALRHPNLVEIREHFPIAGGYIAVFSWFPGEGLRAPDETQCHQDSPRRRHRNLPLERRLDSLDAIVSFHEHVALSGYVAIDFYDGSILYDFAQHSTRICDIDFYHQLPYSNPMGRMWGSTRFMSPEEFELGAVIDEVTNVFNMGATAFALLGGEVDRSFEKWEGSEALYEVALKAVSPDRSGRYASVSAFREAWNQAERCS
jgi:serine/threonine-protein kinase